MSFDINDTQTEEPSLFRSRGSSLPVGVVPSDALKKWLEVQSEYSFKVKNSHDRPLMATAFEWAKESYCKRRQVGAVISRDGRTLATGYNGTISGTPNECEIEYVKCIACNKHTRVSDLTSSNNIPCITGVGYKYECSCGTTNTFSEEGLKDNKFLVTNELTMHAEQNAIAFCSKHGIATDGCTMYVTTSPCKNCSKLIASVGIHEVVYAEEYKDTSGIDFLRGLGITVRQYNKEGK